MRRAGGRWPAELLLARPGGSPGLEHRYACHSSRCSPARRPPAGRLPHALHLLRHRQGRLRQEPAAARDRVPSADRAGAVWPGEAGAAARGLPAPCPMPGQTRSRPPQCLPRLNLPLLGLASQRVSNVVMMGMGEPLLNLPSVLRAHDILTKDLGIGAWVGEGVVGGACAWGQRCAPLSGARKPRLQWQGWAGVWGTSRGAAAGVECAQPHPQPSPPGRRPPSQAPGTSPSPRWAYPMPSRAWPPGSCNPPWRCPSMRPPRGCARASCPARVPTHSTRLWRTVPNTSGEACRASHGPAALRLCLRAAPCKHCPALATACGGQVPCARKPASPNVPALQGDWPPRDI